MDNIAYNNIIQNKQDLDDWQNGVPPTPSKFWEHFARIYNLVNIHFREDILYVEKIAKAQRELSKNKFGESKEGFMRNIVLIPRKIDLLVKLIYGQRMPFASEFDYYKQVWKKYPQFRAAEKI